MADNPTPHVPIRLRPVREITAEEENFRVVPVGRVEGDAVNVPHMVTIKRDMVKPEPEGTVVMMAFVVSGYDRDCDGSALARLTHINVDGLVTGWSPTGMSLHPRSAWVLDNLDDLPKLP